MLSWMNVLVLVVATSVAWGSYFKSVAPAKLAKQIGPSAYLKCAWYRKICMPFMAIVFINYVIYYFYPLPIGIPAKFGWPWLVSAVIATLIAVPAGYALIRGLLDAGEETMTPKPEHAMYGGIYQKMRHPQTVGEIGLWLAFALVLNSPFLAVYVLVWIPAAFYCCVTEERDLVLRYGSAYQEYRRRTCAFLPGLW